MELSQLVTSSARQIKYMQAPRSGRPGLAFLWPAL